MTISNGFIGWQERLTIAAVGLSDGQPIEKGQAFQSLPVDAFNPVTPTEANAGPLHFVPRHIVLPIVAAG
jgi:hypothetical protein